MLRILPNSQCFRIEGEPYSVKSLGITSSVQKFDDRLVFMTGKKTQAERPRLRAGQWVFDCLIAGLIGIICFASTLGGPATVLEAMNILLIVAALVIRRVFPRWSLGLAWLSAVTQIFSVGDVSFAQIGTVIVVYSVVAYGKNWEMWAAAISVVVGSIIGSVRLAMGESMLDPIFSGSNTLVQAIIYLIIILVLLGVAWLLGLVTRSIRRFRAVEAQRENARMEAERSREIAALQYEKAELARDVHDVIGHSLAVIIAQSDAVRFLPESDIEGIKRGVAIIADTARTSLADVRGVLNRIGESESSADADRAVSSRAPTDPGIDDIPDLIERIRLTGAHLRQEETGVRVRLDVTQELVVYRVLQEMLTNALKHGDRGGEIRVLRAWTHDSLVITVDNAVSSGSIAPGQVAAPGNGTVGMRSRLADVGGTLTLRAPVTTMLPTFSATAQIPYYPHYPVNGS